MWKWCFIKVRQFEHNAIFGGECHICMTTLSILLITWPFLIHWHFSSICVLFYNSLLLSICVKKSHQYHSLRAIWFVWCFYFWAKDEQGAIAKGWSIFAGNKEFSNPPLLFKELHVQCGNGLVNKSFVAMGCSVAHQRRHFFKKK